MIDSGSMSRSLNIQHDSNFCDLQRSASKLGSCMGFDGIGLKASDLGSNHFKIAKEKDQIREINIFTQDLI